MKKKSDNTYRAGEDDDLFQRQMSDVTPLQTKPRISAEKPRLSPHRRHAEELRSDSTHFVEREHARSTGPEEALLFARSGVQHRLLRQLKRGELRPEARIDLHGHTVAEAGEQLAVFLAEASEAGLRYLSVIHGKGYRSVDGRPALKSQVNQWLRDSPCVLAFSSAQPKDGGMGALYILLRR